MIIHSSSQAAGEVRSSRSDSSSVQTGAVTGQDSKVIKFPGNEVVTSKFGFRPATSDADVVVPFKPKQLVAGRSKARFKLMVFKPGRYRRAGSETQTKIIDAGLGTIPIDYFPEVA